MTIFSLLGRLFLFEYDRLKAWCSDYLMESEAADIAAYALSQLFLAGLNRYETAHGPYYELYRIACDQIRAVRYRQADSVPVTWRRTIPLPTAHEGEYFLTGYSLLAFIQARHPMGVRERQHLATAIASYLPELHSEQHLEQVLALDPATAGIIGLVRDQVGSWQVENARREPIPMGIARAQQWRHNEWVDNQAFIRKELADVKAEQDHNLGRTHGQEAERHGAHGGPVGFDQPVRDEHRPARLHANRGNLA